MNKKIPTLDASNFDLCKQYIGKEIEVVGRVHEVVDWRKRYGQSAQNINVNFGDYKGEIIKIIIPISMIDAQSWWGKDPNTWTGLWVSITGILTEEGPQKGRVHPGHLAINVSHESDLVLLHEIEAKRKLYGGENAKSTLKIHLNDTIDYVEVSRPEELLTIQIVTFEGDVSKGQINKNAPLAVKFLGKEIGEEFEFNIQTQKSKTYRIVMINRVP
ncbi:MAG: GreA/GreB family elongation factor [Leptospirales bacterium]